MRQAFFVGSLFRYSFVGSRSVYNIEESDAILNDVVGRIFSNMSAAFFICGDALEGIQAKILPVSVNPTYSVKIVSGGECATLSYNETNKSYSLTGVSEGKTVLETKISCLSKPKCSKSIPYL